MPNIIIPMNNELLLPYGTTLPPASADKLSRLEIELADLNSLTGTAVERLRSLEEQTLSAEQRLLDAQRSDNETAQRQHQAQIDKLMAQRRALSLVLSERNSRANEMLSIFTRLRAWAEKLPAGTRFEASPEEQVGSKPVTADRISAVRAKIVTLQDEREAVQNAPPPADVLKDKIAASVHALANSADHEARPAMTAFLNGKGPIVAPYVDNRRYFSAGAIQFDARSDVLGLLAWLDPERMIARFSAEVDANRKDPEAEITDEARAKRLAEIEEEILALDRHEEALIDAAKVAGQDIARRPDASPLALLGIKFGTKASTGGEAMPVPKVRKEAPEGVDGASYGMPNVTRVAS